MRDSEPNVNESPPASAVYESESKLATRANVPNMASNRDTVLTDFVRMKIAEWQAAGREQQELAELAGFGKSTVAQVKRGTGVGAKTAPGFARAFGFPNVQAMVDAAYEWRKGSGEALDELLAEEAVKSAVETIKTLVVGSTDESLRAILAAFIHPRFRGRDFKYWVETLGTEARRDVDAALAHEAELRARRLEKDRAIRREEGEWRAEALKKNQANEAAAELARREAAADAEVEKRRKRRKIRAV